MITKRFLQRLRQQDWTGVFIELVIVVFGVFIGMQASNWNQARLDRAEGHRIIEQIYKDVQDSIALQAKKTPLVKADFESTRDLAHMLRTGQASGLSEAQLQKRILKTGPWTGLIIIDTTLEEVNRSSQIDLIENERLRREIESYYDDIQGRIIADGNIGKVELQNIQARLHELTYDWKGENHFIVTPRSEILANKELDSTLEAMTTAYNALYHMQLAENEHTLHMRDVLAAYLHKKTKP